MAQRRGLGAAATNLLTFPLTFFALRLAKFSKSGKDVDDARRSTFRAHGPASHHGWPHAACGGQWGCGGRGTPPAVQLYVNAMCNAVCGRAGDWDEGWVVAVGWDVGFGVRSVGRGSGANPLSSGAACADLCLSPEHSHVLDVCI